MILEKDRPPDLMCTFVRFPKEGHVQKGDLQEAT